MRRGRMLRWIARSAGVAGVVLAVLAVRVVISSSAELQEGHRLRRADDLEAAIVHYRRAARFYAPGNPYSVEALESLAEMARAAEERGEVDLALAAWRAVRSAVMSTRSFYTPHADRLEEADVRIATLMSRLDAPPIDAGKSRARIRREHLALLRAHRGPNIPWALVLLFGFAMWVSGAFAFAVRAIDAEDRLVKKEALRCTAAIVLGLALFVLGLSLA